MLQYCFYGVWFHFPSRLLRGREGVETNYTFSSTFFRIVKYFLPQISQHPCRASALRIKQWR